MLFHVLLVGVGGAAGSILRYGLTLATKSLVAEPGLPWGTLAANVLGCFFSGLFTEWAGSRFGMSNEVRLLLTTGFCGGFTTLSTFLFETNTLFREGQWAPGVSYIGLSLVLPFAALWAGIATVKVLERL